MATKHTVSSENQEEPDFLKPGATLTDEEKAKYFDQLRLKFVELCNQFSNSEKKFSYLQEKLKSLEKRKFKPRSKFGKTFKGFANSSGEYEDIPDDDTIPAGWKSAYKSIEGLKHLKNKLKVYWAPNGRYCSSRRGALQYMVDELGSDPADVEIMKKGLVEDGWLEDKENLPVGWFFKSDTNNVTNRTTLVFLKADFQYCKNTRTALKNMINGSNSDAEIGKFICKYVTRNGLDPSGISWLESDSIPYPWRVANTRGGKGKVVISPGGQVFTCIKTAGEFIDASDDIDDDQKKRFYSILGCENQMKVKTEYKCKEEKESFDDQNIKEDETFKRIKQEKLVIWICDDKSAPPNWKTALNPNISKNVSRIPRGRYFRTE